jgi:hypothetical protein
MRDKEYYLELVSMSDKPVEMLADECVRLRTAWNASEKKIDDLCCKIGRLRTKLETIRITLEETT